MLDSYKSQSKEFIDQLPPEELKNRRRLFRRIAVTSGIVSVCTGVIAAELLTNGDTTTATGTVIGVLAAAASVSNAANIANSAYHSHLVTGAIDANQPTVA